MKNILLTSLVALALGTASASAQLTIATYLSAEGETMPASATADNVSATALTRGAGISVNAGSTFNSNGFDSSSLEDAITAEDYFTFTISADSGFSLEFSSLDIRYDRSNSGPPNFVAQASVDGGSYITFFTDTSVSASSEDNAGIAMTALGSGSSFAFRFVGFGASSSGGTFDFENSSSFGNQAIVFEGLVTASAVPEPSTYALLAGLGMIGFVAYRRRKAAAQV